MMASNNRVFTIRGQQVMIDRDLAELYGVTVKRLNERVKRNKERFPNTLRFQLTETEFGNLRSQIATSNKRGGRRYLPFVFTEEGVLELSNILKKTVDLSSLFKEQKQRLVVVKDSEISYKIHRIRGVDVIFDFALAKLYDVKARRLREQVKRNINRFPSDFMFQLSDEEISFMVSQNATPQTRVFGGSRPYVFTEQGIASLSSVLNSDRAVEVNIEIIRAFVKMRKMLMNNAVLFQRLDGVEKRQLTYQIETDKKIDEILNVIDSRSIKPEQGVFYNGEIFDAYSFVVNLIRGARKSIVLIDNYVDDTVFTLLMKRAKGVSVTIYTKNINKQLNLDLRKHNEQYPPVEMIEFNDSHDRFLILDESEIYHIGASLKDVGKKWFAFSKMELQALDMLNRLKSDRN